ncbi:MAG TPA: cytochrome b [Sphingomicrobium sp.]|nr:cytochrome b [Sphingomicrobium sp.]
MPARINASGSRNAAPEKYPAALRAFHWAVVMLLILQFSDAWTMPHIGRGTVPIGLIAWHLFFGTLILALMVARLSWRTRVTVPEPPASLPPLLQSLSRLVHYMLYFGLVLVALLGWANASSRGWHIKFLGFVPLPAIMPSGSSLGRQLGDVHATLATALLYLIGFHVAAALYHAAVLRDGLLRRMI